MSPSRTVLIGVFASLAIVEGSVRAQDEGGPPMTATPAVRGGCTPGACTHRTAIGRRRCKRHLQDAFLGYPEEFERPPLGALMHAAGRQQVGNAEAAAMILNHYDFEPGTANLKTRGRDKLGVIAARLPTSFAPVIVERSEDGRLDAARRSAVLAGLEAGPFPIPPGRVLIGPAVARGTPGEEAEIVHQGMLLRTSLGGPVVGSAVAPSSSAGSR